MGANCLPIQAPRLARKARRVRPCESEIGGRNRKSTPLRMPPGKIVQAQALLVQGHSQREIGRTLHMSPMTVAKIIRTEDFQGFIKEQQERLFAIAPDAIESFRAQVKVDGHLAYVFLKDLQIIPSRETLMSVMNPPLTEDEGFSRQAKLVASVLLAGHEHLGIDLPPEIQQVLADDERKCSEEAKSPPAQLSRR
jgi:hypothetical protein